MSSTDQISEINPYVLKKVRTNIERKVRRKTGRKRVREREEGSGRETGRERKGVNDRKNRHHTP